MSNEYDMKIHQSRSAKDWAQFFMKIKNEVNFTIDEDLMIGWFANAMMAVHDSIFNNEINKLQSENKILRDVVAFYADPENWDREHTTRYEIIKTDDCADYPHITRDVRETGGKRAREALEKIKQETKDKY